MRYSDSTLGVPFIRINGNTTKPRSSWGCAGHRPRRKIGRRIRQGTGAMRKTMASSAADEAHCLADAGAVGLGAARFLGLGDRVAFAGSQEQIGFEAVLARVQLPIEI